MDDTAPIIDFSRNQEELAGKTAIVTGSTRGSGLGIARAFAAAGMTVMMNGLGDRLAIEKTRRSLETEFGIAAAYSDADMSKPDQIILMVEETRTAFGRVDVLV